MLANAPRAATSDELDPDAEEFAARAAGRRCTKKQASRSRAAISPEAACGGSDDAAASPMHAPVAADVASGGIGRKPEMRRWKSSPFMKRELKTTVVDTAEYKVRTSVRPWWIIDPRSSKKMQTWDFVITAALIFTAFVTPVEVSFMPPPETALDALFIINRFVDVIFIIDMALQFVLMYPEEGREGARWIFDPVTIWKHYLKSWFLLDLVSILVSVFDYMFLLDTGEGDGGNFTNATAGGDIDDGTLENVSKLKALRVLRVLRLIKLLRLLRMSRIVKRWESKVAINYAAAAIVKVFLSLLLWAHLCACLWTLQADLVSDYRYQTWLGYDGLCKPVVSASGKVYDACESPGELYVASLYWSVMTITSIGYGDIHPHTWKERVICVVVMLIGSVLWGQLIGTFCSVVATFNPEAAEFRRTMDELNRFMRLEGLDSAMRQRLREYFHQTKHLRLTLAHRHLLQQMSPHLQGEVAWRINERWLRRVWFLAGAEHAFVVQVSLQLAPMVFSPGELIPTGFMYIVHRGIALYGGKVLTAGKVWGEDMILASATLQRQWCARAMNFLCTSPASRRYLTCISAVSRQVRARDELPRGAHALARGAHAHGRAVPAHGQGHPTLGAAARAAPLPHRRRRPNQGRAHGRARADGREWAAGRRGEGPQERARQGVQRGVVALHELGRGRPLAPADRGPRLQPQQRCAPAGAHEPRGHVPHEPRGHVRREQQLARAARGDGSTQGGGRDGQGRRGRDQGHARPGPQRARGGGSAVARHHVTV